MKLKEIIDTVWFLLVGIAAFGALLGLFWLLMMTMASGLALLMVIGHYLAWLVLPVCVVWVLKALFKPPEQRWAEALKTAAVRAIALPLIVFMVTDTFGALPDELELPLIGIAVGASLVGLAGVSMVEVVKRKRARGGEDF